LHILALGDEDLDKKFLRRILILVILVRHCVV
jgi:hypothetical protein